ncbi:hypothetical protein HY212_06575 [Candidatus Pacearchaeota archaeon]|nr:hypothetical protein [Candidatus Pacearchaeota archaeon]
MRNERVREGILPKDGKVAAYTISYVNLIDASAKKTRDNLRVIYYDAMAKISEDLDRGRSISVVGVSIGNVLSVRCASSLPGRKVNELVSLVGGSRLGFSAWDSIATSHIAQSSGLDIYQYEDLLREFAPIENLKGLHSNRIFARFGSSDLMIRYDPHGKELKSALESIDARDKDVKTYLWADHSSAILRASREGIHDNLK